MSPTVRISVGAFEDGAEGSFAECECGDGVAYLGGPFDTLGEVAMWIEEHDCQRSEEDADDFAEMYYAPLVGKESAVGSVPQGRTP